MAAQKKTKSTKKRVHTGWAIRGRPFSPTEFKQSSIHINSGQTYASYLASFSRQYGDPKKRKELLRK